MRHARQSGLSAEALTFGDTPLSVALALLRAAGVTAGDVVVDPLAGRGAVLLAARALGAEARGVELDAAHVAVAAAPLASAGAHLVQGDARSHDYAAATCVFLAWACLDAPARAAVAERVRATARAGTRVVAVTWDPPGAVVGRARRSMPWGRVDVVHALL